MRTVRLKAVEVPAKPKALFGDTTNVGNEKTGLALPYVPDDEIPGTGMVVVRVIGAGGMGSVVYLVFDRGLRQHRTLKLLLRSVAHDGHDDAASIERLRKEAVQLAALRHRNIVRVILFGITSDAKRLPYFVMEEANGASLYKIVKQAKRTKRDDGEPLIGLTETLDIAIELFDALAYLHDQGILHRDLKTDNVVIDREGPVAVTKIIDFGLSTTADEQSFEARSFVGTPLYAAPEQFDGTVLTPKADLYSAGQTIYEVLIGRTPFEHYLHADRNRSFDALEKAHRSETPIDVRQFVRDVPDAFADLIMALLAKVPADRPRSARDVASTLRMIKREYHSHYSMPDIDLRTDPGRTVVNFFDADETTETKSTKITRDVYASKTVDLNASTDVDTDFTWLEELKREHKEREREERATLCNPNISTRSLQPLPSSISPPIDVRPLPGRGLFARVEAAVKRPFAHRLKSALDREVVYVDPTEAYRLVEQSLRRRQAMRSNVLLAISTIGAIAILFGAARFFAEAMLAPSETAADEIILVGAAMREPTHVFRLDAFAPRETEAPDVRADRKLAKGSWAVDVKAFTPVEKAAAIR